MLNRPTGLVDPSGHYACGDGYENDCGKKLPASTKRTPGEPKRANIPKPRTYYPDCPDGWCKHLEGPDENILAHVVHGESGDAQSAADVLQVLLNRAYNYWTCPTCSHGFLNPQNLPWNTITADELLRLLAYIATEPETPGMIRPDPAFDAAEVAKDYNSKLYPGIALAIDIVIQSAGMYPGIVPLSVNGLPPQQEVRDTRVMYFYSSTSYEPIPYPDRVYVLNDPVGQYRYQHYYYKD